MQEASGSRTDAPPEPGREYVNFRDALAPLRYQALLVSRLTAKVVRRLEDAGVEVCVLKGGRRGCGGVGRAVCSADLGRRRAGYSPPHRNLTTILHLRNVGKSRIPGKSVPGCMS